MPDTDDGNARAGAGAGGRAGAGGGAGGSPVDALEVLGAELTPAAAGGLLLTVLARGSLMRAMPLLEESRTRPSPRAAAPSRDRAFMVLGTRRRARRFDGGRAPSSAPTAN